MSTVPHVNLLPGCQKPADCRAKKGYLCANCVSVSLGAPVSSGTTILRITLSASRRRRLGDMAREAGISADVLASRLLTALIDDDAAAHGEKIAG